MRKDSLKYLSLDETPTETAADTGTKAKKKKKKDTASATHKGEEDESSEIQNGAKGNDEAPPSLTRKKTEVLDDVPVATATSSLPSDASSTSSRHSRRKSKCQQLTRKRSSTIGEKEISDSKAHESHAELGIFTRSQKRFSRSFGKLRNSVSFAMLHFMKSEGAPQKPVRTLKHDGSVVLNDLQRIVSLSTTSVPQHRRNRSEVQHRDATAPMMSKPLPRPRTLCRKRSFSVNGINAIVETMK